MASTLRTLPRRLAWVAAVLLLSFSCCPRGKMLLLDSTHFFACGRTCLASREMTMSFHAGDMFELATTTQQPVMEMLSLFPSAEAIKRGDKDYHKAVNIAAEMHARCDDPPLCAVQDHCENKQTTGSKLRLLWEQVCALAARWLVSVGERGICTAAALVSTQDMGTMRAANGAFPWFDRCDVQEQRKRGRCPQGSWYQTGNICGGEARRCSVRGRCEGSSTWLTTDQGGMQVEKRMRQSSRSGRSLSKLSV